MDVKHIEQDEIDLLSLIQTIWDGKWLIVLTTILSGLGMFGFQTTQPAPNFSAKTDIYSISPVDAEYYQGFNALRLFEITPDLLSGLYISQLRNGKLFETAIEDIDILDKTKFSSEED